MIVRAARSTTPRLVLALLAAALTGSATASAAIPWAPCPTQGYECAHVDVPLDRSGTVPGTISLAVSRAPAASNPNHSAVVALAGGPGQAALNLTQDFAQILAPAIANRDLLVYDQRGTGLSGALDCDALHERLSPTVAATRCADQLGPRRAFYRTSDSVQDIEALREQGGYDKLILFGVSYGTKVAEDYAAAYPSRVEALVLDSVVLPEGPDPFQRSSLQAVPRVLSDLCAGRECAGVTPNVDRDLSAELAKLRKGPLRGTVITATGHRSTYQMRQTGMLDILLAGDLNPTLRAELPGSIRAALKGDAAPLLRLSVRSEGLTTGQQTAGGDSDALFLATTCEEMPFPWTRTAGPQQRAQEIIALADQIPREQLGPFSPLAAVQGGAIPFCLGWPNATPAPAASGQLPQVPTLVLDGQMDLRTPFEDAQKLASRIPGAALVEIPATGHSVFGSDPQTCAKDSLATFIAGGAPGACPVVDNPFSPTPRPPVGLSSVVPLHRKGVTGRTLGAGLDTVVDAYRQIIGEAMALNRAPRRVGGLRGGNATVSTTAFKLRSYQYVRGVRVSGTIHFNNLAGTITIHGGGAARGTIRISKREVVGATLNGRRYRFGSSSAIRRHLPTLREILARPRIEG
jgi:pimeloyl-ACP methyl ester carboxylesterase